MRYPLLPLLLLPLSACDVTEPGEAGLPPESSPLSHTTLDDDRRFHPVVLSGDRGLDLDPLIGVNPGDVVAFAYDGARARFVQIPVQVDERFVYDLAVAYEGTTQCPRRSDGTYGPWCENLTNHVTTLGYADPGTAVGRDNATTFDTDDEIALLLSDFGDRTTSHPKKVINSTRVEVEVSFQGATSYAYLYKRKGTALNPSAGVDYVVSAFQLVNGTFGSYNVVGIMPGGNPPRPGFEASNPENTTITGRWYAVEFADRWIMNGLKIGEAGAMTGDLLEVDMLKLTDDPGTPALEGCDRTPYTGSQSEGAIVVNRDGPVRAIRRVVGFNSGPLTEMTWFFYPYGMESEFKFRVHQTGWGVMHFFDLADAVTSPTYASGAGGTGNVGWQTLTLPSTGGWAVTNDVTTDIALTPSARLFYKDDATPTNCLFDNNYHRAAHGVEVPHQSLPNTDPRGGAHNQFSARRHFAFGPEPAVALAAIQEAPSIVTR